MKSLRERVIRAAESRDEFIPLEDGFYRWFPRSLGGVSSEELRILADHLDEKNAVMKAELEHFFGGADNAGVDKGAADWHGEAALSLDEAE